MHIVTEKLVNTMIEDKNREAKRFLEGQKALRLAQENKPPKKTRWQTFQNFAKMVFEKAQLPDEVSLDEGNPYSADIIAEEPQQHLYERIAQGNALEDAEYRAKKLHEGKF